MIEFFLTALGVTLVAFYCLVFLGLAIFGAHRYWLVHRYFQFPPDEVDVPEFPGELPAVLVQLPLFNERYVVDRLLGAIEKLDYPRDRLRIQVIDDSNDETTQRVEAAVSRMRRSGFVVEHLRRPDRAGYKAGALAFGLERTHEEFVAIFDADFVPTPDFLRRTMGAFSNERVGMVQTRWTYVNGGYSLLTRIQAMMLNGHFVMEHGGRFRGGCFFNFNGTAGIWRRRAIEEAGGWEGDTVTEDLDLSYRSQLAGWKFLYAAHIESPSELPVQMSAFKSQQQRWTRGASQTARKMLGRISAAPISFRLKLESALHLLGNTPYVLLVLLAVLLLPVYWLRDRWNLGWVMWVDLPMLLGGTFALASFYANSQRELGESPWRAIACLPALMALGIGLSINNAWAAVDGFRSTGGEFVRTPKFGIETTSDTWRSKTYRPRRHGWIWAVEGLMVAYLALTLVFVLRAGLWAALPFLVLFLSGYGYIFAEGLRERFVSEPPAAVGELSPRRAA